MPSSSGGYFYQSCHVTKAGLCQPQLHDLNAGKLAELFLEKIEGVRAAVAIVCSLEGLQPLLSFHRGSAACAVKSRS